MKRIMVYLLILAMVFAFVPTSSFAFRRHDGNQWSHNRGSHSGVHHRGGGNFLPGIVAGIGAAIIYNTVIRPRYDYPRPAYTIPSYTNTYDREYQLEMERLRQEEYQEQQRLQAEQERLRQEQAREDARRDFYDRYRR